MDWATKRQLQYLGMLFLFVVIFMVIPFYIFIYKPPTCFDGIQNGGETGIDCGGSCRLLCTADIAVPVSRFDPRIFQMASGTVSVLAYMENVNVAAESFHAPYEFKLYDSQGNFITSKTGETYIPKGQAFAIFEPNISTGSRIATRATFAFTQALIWVRNTTPYPSIGVTNSPIENASTTPRVDAIVTNNSLGTVSNLDFVVMVSDGAGNTIGASHTFIDSLGAGATQNIAFTWPKPFSTTAVACQSPVDVALILDRSGSMAALGKNPPEPLTDVKNAAIYFANQLDQKDYGALVSFANTATTTAFLSPMSDPTFLNNAIDQVAILTNGVQNTNIEDGIAQAYNELNSPRHRAGVSTIMVLLTDGVADLPTKVGDSKYPEASALAAAQLAKDSGTRIFTIGLGKDVNVNFLQSIASSPTDSYLAPSATVLSGIYSQIATSICKQTPAVVQIISRVFPYSIVY
jgi:Mg-chelatase subunit ChlD